jgi:hypothetical protein
MSVSLNVVSVFYSDSFVQIIWSTDRHYIMTGRLAIIITQHKIKTRRPAITIDKRNIMTQRLAITLKRHNIMVTLRFLITGKVVIP